MINQIVIIKLKKTYSVYATGGRRRFTSLMIIYEFVKKVPSRTISYNL